MSLPAAAAPGGAGVATAVTGQVTVSRPTSQAQQPLRFKDEIYLRDHISTAANSLARLLLDKKALITVRELSELEITDQAGTSTVHLGMGKIAIGVARQRMRSGETVEVRTQNAVAAIRGTVVVAETLPSLGGTIPVSRLHVLRGYIDVSAPGNPGAPPIRMVAPSSVTVTGDTVGQPESLTDTAKAALLADLALPGTYLTGLAESLATGEQARAVALARIITGEGSGGDEILDLQAPPADPLAPITPPVPTTSVASTAVSGPVSSLPSVFDRQTVTIKGDFYTVPKSSTENISTDFLEATTSTLTVGSNVLNVMGSMDSTTTLPFISLSSSTLGAKILALLNGGSLSLTGTLLDAVNSTVSMNGSALVDVRAGSFLTGSSGSPFVSFTNGSLTVTSEESGGRGFLFETGSATALAGGLLRTNGTDITTGDLLSVTGRVTGSGTGAFLALADGTVSAKDVALIGSGGGLSLAGGLLDRSGATLATTDDLVNISAGGRLTGTGTGALLTFTNATANIGNGAGDQYFQVTGAGSSAALAGPLLTASAGSTLKLTGSALVDVSTSGTLTDTTTSALMTLTGGKLQIAGANGFAVSSLGTVNLSGGLLSTSGTNISSTGDFVLGQTKGRFIVMTGSTASLLSLAGGTSTIATDGSIFHLIGTATALDPVTGLTLGTEEPIQHGGGFLDMNAATVATARVVRVDVALLQASAPLLNLFGGAQLTTSNNVIDLTAKAKATNTGTFVALDQSRLIVNNGALVRVAEGSFLKGGGNLINLANGSTLTINNGVLLFISGGSVVNISGALIAFSGSPGNIVNVSNTLSFIMIGGIPVSLTGGALASNVIITGTPIKNPTLGTITPHTALIQVNGPTTKLTISGN